MRIPDQKIDEVRSAADIIDVVAGYVRLKKRGKNFLGLCPFHQEKTPSFTVSQEKQMFHCFGCGKGGNVFTFLMDLEKVSFVEAVRTLAERFAIPLPVEGSSSNAEATENEHLYNICRAAGLHFHENLGTVEGKLALEYFHHRGFTDETIRKFGLGYSLNTWDDLLRHAPHEGDSALMEKAGLAIRRDDGSGYYDRFRGRAMFPIFSSSGRVIAFGARKMRENDPVEGKYINSPETKIYSKSKSLYGLYQSKDAIREQEYAILVEGYADLISVFQAGIENVVASSGTALTPEQIQLIARYAKNITLVYDADSAGSKAALRGVDLIIEGGLDVKVAALPEGDDPDSFVKKHGGKEFTALLENAVSFLDFKANTFKDQGYLETPEGQTKAVRSIVETISKVKDELKRSFYLKSVAERYGVYESVLLRELDSLLGHDRKRVRMRNDDAARKDTVPAAKEKPQTPGEALSPAQRDLLKLMLEHGATMVRTVLSQVPQDTFEHGLASRLVHIMVERSNEGVEWDAGSLVNDADDEVKNFIADLIFTKYEISKGWTALNAEPEKVNPMEIAEHCFILLRRQEIERLIETNQKAMKEASGRGEPLQQFMERHRSLLEEKKELLKKSSVSEIS